MSELKEMALERARLVAQQEETQRAINELDKQLSEKIDCENVYATIGKSDGDYTFTRDGCKVKLSKKKTVKYDKDILKRSASGLTWGEISCLFKVDFGMNETNYKRLQKDATTSEKLSEVASIVEEAREVRQDAAKVVSITLTDEVDE